MAAKPSKHKIEVLCGLTLSSWLFHHSRKTINNGDWCYIEYLKIQCTGLLREMSE